MSDDRSRTPDGTIDQAIDRAVRDLVTGEAPADLRARVLARLEAPATAAAWWSPGRIVTVAAAVAVSVVVTYLAWPSRPAPVAEPTAVVAEARPPAATPAETPTPAGTVTPAAASERVVTAAAVVEPERHRFATPPSVEPLEAPPVVAIDPLVERHLAIEPLVVDRLSFEQVVIEPLRLER